MSDTIGQQELVEPGPLRSEQRPSADAGYWWGVDPSTRCIAIAWTDGQERGVRSHAFSDDLKEGQRFAAMYDASCHFARELAAERPPAFVWVEQPAAFGRQVEPQLYYAVGVIQAAVFSALEHLYQWPVWVETVPLAHWKKRGLGNGAAKKPAIMEWARRQLPDVALSQDEADALGIAEAARRTVSFG